MSTTIETTDLKGVAARLVETVYSSEEGWISPLALALSGVESEEASWKPSADVASIWELTAHTSNYLDSAVLMLEGKGPKGKFEDWPEASGDWVSLRDQVIDLAGRFRRAVASLSSDSFSVPVEGGKTAVANRIMDIAAHDAYHAGQIVKLRQIYAAK